MFGLFFGLFLVFGSIWLIMTIIKLIRWLFVSSGKVFLSLYNEYNIYRHDRKNGYIKEDIRKKLEKSRYQQEIDEQANRKLVMTVMNFVSAMRVKYPLADEHLFKEAAKSLPQSGCLISHKDFEEIIKESHIKNSSTYFPKKESKFYTLKDVDNLSPIEVRLEKPIQMQLFKIDSTYVLRIFNLDTNENTLLQTDNYSMMMSYIIEVMNMQQALSKYKQSVRSAQLEDVFKEKLKMQNQTQVDNNDLGNDRYKRF